MMKKIGLIVTNLVGSGAEKVVLHLADMFEKQGDEVHIFLLEDKISYDIKGAKIHLLSKDRSVFKLFKGWGDTLLARKLRSIVNTIEAEGIKFDLFLSNLPAADRVMVKADLPNTYYIIHTSYSMEIEEFRKRGKLTRAIKKEKLYHHLYKGKDLIAVSLGIKEDLDKMSIAYNSCNVIYNPFDFETICEMANEESPVIIEGEYILSASAFRPIKRHDILLEAYSKLSNPPPLKLLCEFNVKLKKMIVDLNLVDKVEILGFISNPYPIIKQAKLLVLSSEREGLPTVLIEALILNTPVVSTDCISGPSEILTGELVPFLAKINDSYDLSKKIDNALSEDLKITKEHIEKFNRKSVFLQYQNLIFNKELQSE